MELALARSSMFEHFYRLLDTTLFNLINGVSGIVINKVNPNLYFTNNKYVSDYNIEKGIKLWNSSYITTDTVNENSNYTIFISFFFMIRQRSGYRFYNE